MSAKKYIFAGGDIVTPERVINRGAIAVEGGTIVGISDRSAATLSGEWDVVDCTDRVVMPGFIDVHTHGGVGCDFTDDTPETFAKLSRYYYSHGVTTLLATLSPLPHSLLIPAVGRLSQYCHENQTDSNIFGIHLEGPFINRLMRGGNREEYIEPPNLEHWREALARGEGFIRLMTVAPELQGIMPIIQSATENGIVIALGHSSANGEITAQAIAMGASQVTHVFNSMPPLHHRETGILAQALLSDKLDTQLIADGTHVHPAIIMLATKLKTPEHILLITDSIRATQVGDGEYSSAGETVSVENGVVHLCDGTLAGSTLVMERALRLIVEEVGVDLPSASRMASLNAARSLSIEKETGSLEVGKSADIVVLDREFNVEMTIKRGEFKYKKVVGAR